MYRYKLYYDYDGDCTVLFVRILLYPPIFGLT